MNMSWQMLSSQAVNTSHRSVSVKYCRFSVKCDKVSLGQNHRWQSYWSSV